MTTDLSTATILAVDDVPSNLDVIVEHLRDEPFDLMVSLNGKDALQLARESLPDLILLDVMMPGMDGYTVCEQLKQDPLTRDIPVIFLTANDGKKEEEQGLNLGAADYISKPFSVPILKARIRNQLLLKEKSDMLSRLAMKDALTGVSNRYRLEDILTTEWRRSLRNQTSLGAIFIDIDHFKLYNDSYGHLEGDKCLKQVAGILEQQLRRPGDLLARYGGEEFVVILPETSLASVGVMAEKMCMSVLEAAIPHISSPVNKHVTISLGYSALVPSNEIDEKQFLASADQALYSAKLAGRNQAMASESSLNSCLM